MFREFFDDFYKAKNRYEKNSKEHSLQMKKMSEAFEKKKKEVENAQNAHRSEFDKIYNSYFNLRNK